MRQSWAPREMRGGGTINADGFGAVWWNGGRQGRYRSISPIWSDPTVDETLSHIISGSVLAAVRSATEGMAVEIGACAPFVDEPTLSATTERYPVGLAHSPTWQQKFRPSNC